jgi:hypothetical protein
MVIDRVEGERLGSILLVDERDRLAMDNPVVAFDDQVLARAIADELGVVVREPELNGQRVPLMLPG